MTVQPLHELAAVGTHTGDTVEVSFEDGTAIILASPAGEDASAVVLSAEVFEAWVARLNDVVVARRYVDKIIASYERSDGKFTAEDVDGIGDILAHHHDDFPLSREYDSMGEFWVGIADYFEAKITASL